MTRSARNLIVGGALRRYREAVGFSLADAAAVLGCDRSKLSRIETGQRGIRRAELLRILDDYGAAEDARGTLSAIADSRNAWRAYTPAVPGACTDLAALLTCAATITVYESQQIPLLLQTGPYARALAAADRTLKPDASALLPAMTGELQKAVMKPGGAAIRFVVGEAAFRNRFGDDVTQDQVEQLDATDGASELRVLPFAAAPHPALWAASMTLLEFSGAPEVKSAVHLGGPCGGLFLLGEDEVTSCARLLSELRGMALAGEAAARLIKKAVPSP